MLFAFISLSLKFYYCVITKQMNNNKYYITVSFISCNTYTYSYVITIIVYQMYPNYNQIKSTAPVEKKKKKKSPSKHALE